jgi:deoxyxylulose-5-phosphate synthase
VADADLLIVLNDNCMSIDPNVGALKEYLTDITTSPTYNKFVMRFGTFSANFLSAKIFQEIWLQT